MAKVKFGALVQDARGKLGGMVYARNHAGAYVRQKTSPINPQTDRQLAQRSIFTLASQQWRVLNDAQRAQWNVWAANHPFTDVFGDSHVLAGLSAYLKLNALRLTVGLTQLAVPPADDFETYGPDPTAVDVDGVAGTIDVTLASAASADDIYAVWCTRGLSPGVSFAGPELRLCYAGKPGAVDTWTVTPADFNPLLAFTGGQKVIAYVVQHSQSGQ